MDRPYSLGEVPIRSTSLLSSSSKNSWIGIGDEGTLLMQQFKTIKEAINDMDTKQNVLGYQIQEGGLC